MPNYKRAFIQNAYVFLTIATNNRKPLLIENVELLRESFIRAKYNYNFEIYASVILPDHLHLILLPQTIDHYPKIIFAVKYHFSRNIDHKPNHLAQSKINKGEKGIWQRRYYEHTIKSEKELNNHIDYIHYNPVKHQKVSSVKDWKYSSFNKFVDNGYYNVEWGSSSDIKNILSLNLE